MNAYRYRITRAGLLLTALSFAAIALFAQTVNVQGLIKARSGATVVLQTPDSPKLIVLLNDDTQVGQIQGVLKARRKQMSMAALIPGLAIQVEGTYNDQHELVAKSIKFKGDDLKQAQSIQAGMHETQVRTRQSEEELKKQSAALAAQKQELVNQQEQLAAEQEKVAANKAAIAANQEAIEAAIARFGQLDDYYILDEVTVYFGNGKVNLEAKYKPDLLRLAQKAQTVQAYMIQVKGHASSSGSAALNQKLSEDRAHNVAIFLIQQGRIPLTNMLAPGAMGESEQARADKTAEAEAANRRVVVRVLQNKGMAGI